MRVLLIEKNKPIIATLTAGLKAQGYDLDVTHDSADGDDKARSVHYNAIILNLKVANGEGPGMLQRWRRSGIKSAVFVLTPRNRVADGLRSLDLGADDFLAIPFETEELFARLRALIRRDQEARKAILRVHDLEIDTQTKTARRGGQTIRLTPREFDLLEFLARHRGRVVSRSMIWTSLYDECDRNSSNVVDVYIRYLRQKIDKGFPQPLILTRWGEGYLLRGDEV